MSSLRLATSTKKDWFYGELAIAALHQADFNGDGLVDAADYAVWRDHEGTIGLDPWSPGDANGDGDVDSLDYDAWVS